MSDFLSQLILSLILCGCSGKDFMLEAIDVLKGVSAPLIDHATDINHFHSPGSSIR